MNRIMLVDDEKNILSSLRRALRNEHWEIECFTSATEALKRAEVSNFELFISDFRMPEMNGVEFLTAVKQLQPQSMRLILSGYTDLEALLGAINDAEIYRFLSKPWQDYELISTVEQALHFRKLAIENQRLADQVRRQESKLCQQEMVLQKLEKESPGITKVNWTEDGSIILNEDDI
ncbi:MAG: two-component system probable response regulator PhcQ [Enterobacterales bacterium]|jgi:two-component system probable response regulator PhcQ